MPFSERLTVESAVVLRHPAEIIGIRFSPDGRQVATSDSTMAHFWQLDPTGEWKRNARVLVQGGFLGFFHAGERLLFWRRDEHCILEFSRDGIALATTKMEIQDPFGYIFSPDHRWFLTGNQHGQISLWDGTTFAFVQTFQIIPEEEFLPYSNYTAPWMSDFQFTPDGQTLVLLGLSTQGFVHTCTFDASQPAIFRKAVLPQAPFTSMKLAVDGQTFAGSLSDEKSVEIYETRSLRRLARLQTSDYPCYLAFSPDGAFLAYGTDYGFVSIWSLQTHQRVASFLAHPGGPTSETEPISAIEWSPRGDFLITGGCDVYAQNSTVCDYSVKIWHILVTA